MRILVGAAVPPDPHSGAAGTVWQMNRAMERIGHEVVELWDDDIGRVIQHGNLYYTCELPLRYRHAVIRMCRSKQFDVVELNQPHAFLAFEALARSYPDVLRVNRSHGVELLADEVLDSHRARLELESAKGMRSLASGILQRRLREHWRRVVVAADGVVVSCSQDQAFLTEQLQVQHRRVGVISQGVPEKFLVTESNSSNDSRSRNLISVCQAAFFKAPGDLVRISTKVLRTRPELSFSWVCHPSDHERLLQEFPGDIRGRVHLLPWMNQEELIPLLDQHGVFLFPSYFEGFGKAPLEAMARGLCVVASRVGGMKDYIISGKNGLLVEPGDVDGFVRAVESLLDNPELAGQMSSAARATACEHVWDRFARDVTAFYETLASLRTK